MEQVAVSCSYRQQRGHRLSHSGASVARQFDLDRSQCSVGFDNGAIGDSCPCGEHRSHLLFSSPSTTGPWTADLQANLACMERVVERPQSRFTPPGKAHQPCSLERRRDDRWLSVPDVGALD